MLAVVSSIPKPFDNPAQRDGLIGLDEFKAWMDHSKTEVRGQNHHFLDPLLDILLDCFGVLCVCEGSLYA